ncbi:sortase B protein-sorting domain-containing protein [Bacteroidaceae bacterium HV4-6-C5C]|nr:sortase B protein-sorting domain-containing protein [Bacteroidaceae bacterium HV4-6-C5C]
MSWSNDSSPIWLYILLITL